MWSMDRARTQPSGSRFGRMSLVRRAERAARPIRSAETRRAIHTLPGTNPQAWSGTEPGASRRRETGFHPASSAGQTFRDHALISDENAGSLHLGASFPRDRRMLFTAKAGLPDFVSDKPVLFFDHGARGSVPVEPAEDFARNPAIGPLGPVFVYNVKQDESFSRCWLSCHSPSPNHCLAQGHAGSAQKRPARCPRL